jgi:hypothetical protein
MKARLRRLLGRPREVALGPVLHRIDVLAEDIGARLDGLTRRVEDLEAVVQAVDGRAATAAERAVAQHESGARLARRVEEIERLLSER